MKEKSIIQQNLKKIIGVIVVSVFAIITIYTVFRGSGISLNELTASLKEASWEGILLASVSMLGFIYFDFHGTGFLQNMVRILVGTLLEVGKGKIKPEQIPEILEAKNRQMAGPTAPAQGLCLIKVDY